MVIPFFICQIPPHHRTNEFNWSYDDDLGGEGDAEVADAGAPHRGGGAMASTHGDPSTSPGLLSATTPTNKARPFSFAADPLHHFLSEEFACLCIRLDCIGEQHSADHAELLCC